MASCLGLYIEPHMIKYAKIAKDRNTLRVESFGIKFYDKLGDAIKQVISDTASFKIPISVNLSEEVYDYLYMFSLLSKNDLKKAIKTEFEAMCIEKGTNRNALEARYALVNSLEEKEKVKVIHISVNKNAINTLLQPLDSYTVSTIAPIGTTIPNIANLKQKENILIINMEEQTTITTVVDQKIYQIDKIEEGSREILDSIDIKENSYLKAYEICKNSTIYTMEGKELQEEENEYLDDIMPTLYKIASQVKDLLAEKTMKIDRIYLTGTLSVINNIDLYFQEFFQTEKCEILKPFFIPENVKINIKDYIEVNSAMALALQGLGYGLKDINFKNKSLKDDLNALFTSLNIEVGGSKKEGSSSVSVGSFFSKIFKPDLKEKLDYAERWMLRVAGGILILVAIYTGFVVYLNNAINDKNKEVQAVKEDTLAQISAVEADISKVNTKTTRYRELLENLNNISSQVQENNRYKKAIPNFLSELMFSIPQGVQITSITNPTDRHIVINAQSEKYEQLGYFKAILKTEGLLEAKTITSSSGVKQGNLVTVTIEGDLP